MTILKLDVHKGLPMYFIQERLGGLDYKINYSYREYASVGQELELGTGIYRVDEILEQRNSPLDYGVDYPVFFNSVKCRLVRKVEFKDSKMVERAIV